MNHVWTIRGPSVANLKEKRGSRRGNLAQRVTTMGARYVFASSNYLKEHPGEPLSFKMEAIGLQSSPLWPQATEAIKIQNQQEKNVLNRRGGWGQNLSPKLSLEPEENGVHKAQERKRKRVSKKNSPQQNQGPEVGPTDVIQTRKKLRVGGGFQSDVGSQVKARANSVSRKPCLVLAQKARGIQAQQGLFLGVVVLRAKVPFLERGKKGQFKTIFNPSYWKLAAWGQVLVKNFASRGQAIWRLGLGLKLKVIKRQIK